MFSIYGPHTAVTHGRVHGRVVYTAVPSIHGLYTVVGTVLYTVMDTRSLYTAAYTACTRSCTCHVQATYVHGSVHLFTARLHGPYTSTRSMYTDLCTRPIHGRVLGPCSRHVHGRPCASRTHVTGPFLLHINKLTVTSNMVLCFVMVALSNRADHYICML